MRKQLHVRGSANAEDRARVEQIVVSVAEKFAMLDSTVTSRVPDTIRCYTERFGEGFAIGLRIVGDSVIVDFSDGKDASPRFAAFEKLLVSELLRVFSERIFIPAESEIIEIKSTLPATKESRAFFRKHFKPKH